MKRTLNSHYSASMKSDTYLTPKWIIDALGPFDTDPCVADPMPWPTASVMYTKKQDGLAQPWIGRVWLNPPYSREAAKWLRKLSEHRNGISLLMARTETKDWFQNIWPKADGILFLEGRIYFYDQDGQRLPANCGAAPVLVSYGHDNACRLHDSKIPGKFIPLNSSHLIIVGVSSTWFNVVSMVIRNTGSDADLKPIYDMVERMAPDKVNANPNWRAKVRQQVQRYRLSVNN